jgi:hypothetical protein
VALAHELGHSWDYQDGFVNLRKPLPGKYPDGSRTMTEIVACGVENLIRKDHGLTRRAYYYKNQGAIPEINKLRELINR